MRTIERKPRSERACALVEDTAVLADSETEGRKIIGYVSIALYSDGSAQSQVWRPNSNEHKIGNALFRAWIQSKLAEHFAYGEALDATRAILNGDA